MALAMYVPARSLGIIPYILILVCLEISRLFFTGRESWLKLR